MVDLEEHLQRRINANAKKSAELKLNEDKLEAVSESYTPVEVSGQTGDFPSAPEALRRQFGYSCAHAPA